jgi:hypothetical protein
MVYCMNLNGGLSCRLRSKAQSVLDWATTANSRSARCHQIHMACERADEKVPTSRAIVITTLMG